MDESEETLKIDFLALREIQKQPQNDFTALRESRKINA